MIALLLLVACDNPALDPAGARVGERLFMEPRFAQLFAANAGGDLNAPLAQGDPALDTLPRPEGDIPGPFAGSTMSCRQCHLVDDVTVSVVEGVRTYADFARRSPVPDRGDGVSVTLRNSPALPDMSEPRDGAYFLHFDGEFTSPEALVRGTLTGRNLGWLPEEHDEALAHVAAVIRADDGSFPLGAPNARIPYADLFAGTDPSIPRLSRLPEDERFEVEGASDEEIVDAVSRYVSAYLENLRYARGLESDAHNGSPYDVFLDKNGVPRAPDEGETDSAYADRLREAVAALQDPEWVSDLDQTFGLHPQEFNFGPTELAGLKIFLALPEDGAAAPEGAVGGCVACHTPPRFTDYAMHNTGVSQEEYDGLWGEGAFAALDVPDLERRQADPAPWLPATPAHPDWSGALRAIPSPDDPALADLGAWAVFGNDELPDSQAGLAELIDAAYDLDANTTDAERLDRAIALFKTPSLRSLSQSAPYLHDGSADDLDAVLDHYRRASDAQRAGTLRNGDPRLAAIHLDEVDLAALRAFLLSLNEDYE